MTNIAILGTGMGGCGAAYKLHAEGVRATWYEQHDHHGGHTASFVHPGGFLFDQGPHISFTKDARIQELLANNVGQAFETIQIKLNNYWRGYWPEHPVQLHLKGMPPELVVKVIEDFVKASHEPERPIRNYRDWLLASFGATFAETFPMTYGRKYHTTTADNMSTDWLGPRIYRPSLEEVLKGALSDEAPHAHYITHFRYPERGGFQAYLRAFEPLGDLKLSHQVTALDPKAKELTFANGRRAGYDGVVSSVPLTDLVPMIPGAPREVKEAAALLACSTCVLVNVGIDRADISQGHMTYFYDEDITFTRLSFPHMLSPHNVPAGAGSIQAEVYFSKKYRPLTQRPEDLIAPVIRDLKKVGLVREDDRILHQNAYVVPYANVIFDLDRKAALAIVHGYLDELGIGYCGRYGDWGYLWTDESFISGEKAAEKVLSCLR